MAVVLACTLCVPAQALAKTSDNASSDTAEAKAAATDAGVKANSASGAADSASGASSSSSSTSGANSSSGSASGSDSAGSGSNTDDSKSGASSSASSVDKAAGKDSSTASSEASATAKAASSDNSSAEASSTDGYIVGWTTNGTCEWSIDAKGNLVVRPADGASTGELADASPWADYASKIQTATFNSKVSVKSACRMFAGCKLLRSLDFTGLATTRSTDMTDMLEGCTSLRRFTLGVDFEFETSPFSNPTNTDVVRPCWLTWDGVMINAGDIDPIRASTQTYTVYYCYQDDNIWNKEGDYYWAVHSDGTLVVRPTEIGGTGNLAGSSPWRKNYASKITSVYIEPGMSTTSTSSMFNGCSELNSVDISCLDTSGLTSTHSMFSGCSELSSVDLSSLDTSKVTDMSYMFNGCLMLSSLDLSTFDTSSVTDMSNMFHNCKSLTSLDLSTFDTSKVTDMGWMFYDCSALEELVSPDPLDTSKVTDMGWMFYDCKSLASLDLSSFDTSSVTKMFAMFNSCSSLTSLDLSSFDTSSVTNMGCMFESCTSLQSVDLSSFNTSSVTSMASMFSRCSSIKSLDLSSFDTSKVTDMGWMFYDCKSLASLDLSNFETSSVTNMGCMFYLCESLASLDLSKFDNSNVTTHTYGDEPFTGCSALRSITLGEKYTYADSSYQLPSLSGKDLTGKWYSTTSKQTYSSSDVPTGVASTYIAQRKIDKPKAKSGLVYNGQEQAGVASAYGYTISSEGDSTASATAAGDYKTTVILDEAHVWSDGGSNRSVSVSWSIAKATPVYETPTDLSATYGQTLADVKLPSGDNGSFSWQDDAATSVGNAGENAFKVTYTPSDTANYNVVKDIEVKVAVGTAAIVESMFTVETAGHVYDEGRAIEPEVSSKTLAAGSDYEVSYKDNVNAGTGTVVIAGKGNYAGEVRVSFAIAKATPTYKVPTGLSATYGQTLKDVALPGGDNGSFSWQDDAAASVGNAGENTFKVAFTPSDTANYNVVKDIDVVVSVAKATPVYEVPTGLSATYGQTLKDVTLPEGFSWQNATATSVGSAGEHFFKVTYTPRDTANYNVVSGIQVTVTVSRAKIAAPTAKAGLTYTGKAQVGVANGEGYTRSGTYSATDAGSYKATVTLDANHEWSDGSTVAKTVTWTIARAKVAVPTAKTGLVANGTKQTGVAKGEGYTLSGKTKAKKAGTYTATATLDGNHAWSDGSAAAKEITWSIQLVANGTYQLVFVSSKQLAIGVKDGSKKAGASVQLVKKTEAKSKKWQLTYDSATDSYIVKNVKSGKLLAVKGKAKKGAAVVQQVDRNRKDQRWTLEKVSGGYVLRNLAKPNLLLTVDGGIALAGQNTKIAPFFSDAASQVFKLKQA
jgi:surface protein